MVLKRGYVVASFSDTKSFGRKIAKGFGVKFVEIKYDRFPDGESYIRFLGSVKGKKVIFAEYLDDPDPKLIRLIFALKTSLELGGKKNLLVVPYLPYMRQDKRFNPGECVSNGMMGYLLNPLLDYMLTIDSHIHRIKSLRDVFSFKAVNIKSLDRIGEFIKRKYKDAVIVGPDIESGQWIRDLSKITGMDGIVLLKKRFSSYKVSIKVGEDDIDKVKDAKQIVVFDDIISSGGTMMKIIDLIKKYRKKIILIGVHGIFAGDCYRKLYEKGASEIVSCNTIAHRSNKINLVPSIIEQLKKDLK